MESYSNLRRVIHWILMLFLKGIFEQLEKCHDVKCSSLIQKKNYRKIPEIMQYG